MRSALRCLALMVLAGPAQALMLHWPVACAPSAPCFVLNYMDHDTGPGKQDFTCGHQVYEDAHNGIDITMRDLTAWTRGVDLLAAADGTVLRARDRMDDRGTLDGKERIPKDRMCGNGIVIRHAEGYETQYCHLRQGSVRVRPGQAVRAGEIVAQMGHSGFSSFPHLHLTLRRDGKIIDPYDGSTMDAPCGSGGESLWLDAPPYNPNELRPSQFLPKR